MNLGKGRYVFIGLFLQLFCIFEIIQNKIFKKSQLYVFTEDKTKMYYSENIEVNI